jgi:hypothetical protein
MAESKREVSDHLIKLYCTDKAGHRLSDKVIEAFLSRVPRSYWSRNCRKFAPAPALIMRGVLAVYNSFVVSEKCIFFLFTHN